jgi:hypothetical protein
MEISIEIPQKANNGTTIWFRYTTSKNLQSANNRHIHCSTIHNSQVMESAYVPVNWWMDGENVVSIHNGVLFNHTEEWNFAICGKNAWNGDHQVKWNKPDPERQILYFFSFA